jgi:DNA replication protein DnaC
MYRVAMDKEVVLLDDLGAHRVSDWVEDTVTSIITTRCNQRKALIATTNLVDPEKYTIQEVKDRGLVYHRTTIESRIGPRARSRLFEMCRVIRVNGIDDFRLRRQGEK